MRKLFVLFALAAMLTSSAYAQNKMYPNAISAKLNFIDYATLNNGETKIGQGFELGYFRNVAPFLNVGVPFKVGLVKFPENVNNTTIVSFDLVGRLENMKSEARLVPYAFGGVGYTFEKENNHSSIPFGGGLHFRVSPWAFINLQGEFRKSLTDMRDNLQFGIGYVYLLHASEKKVIPKEIMAKVPDMDKDGIVDSLDHCPNLAGPALALGCPDADSDGLGDAEDQCPNEAGSLETNGCPDYDNDGVADKEDECPTEAGSWNGCPDADFDGIADKNDKCPKEAGPIANQGCPENRDADGDGFADDVDKCPTQAGTNQGCPDSDGDGIADNFDKCPNERGVVENDGCPVVLIKDADGDGTPDENDACPTLAGRIGGCPDADGDGVADKDDKCPTVPGNDGNGCPIEVVKDADNDGISDEKDPCPTQAGALNGCPDADGDGVADKDDKCPTVPGNDGKGCPVAVVKDTDGDGVNDNVDKCPNTPGLAANDGCPEVKKEVREKLAVATKAVQFETGKAILKPESYAVLDEIVSIMRSYPEYQLAISGHTDNIGDDERNLKLSQERAKTCYDYLVFRGIKTERLRHAGFGEARPLAENNTAAGRELNRRVEFEVIFE